MTSHCYHHGARRPKGYLVLAFVLLWPVRAASAQHTSRTTVGALLTAAVDSIELEFTFGRRIAGYTARLMVGRTDSTFVGPLKYHSWRPPWLQAGRPPTRQVCDTSMVVTMSLRDADRLLREIDTISVDAGEPQQRERYLTDIDDYSLLRLRMPSGSLVITDGRAVKYAGAVYHVPASGAPPRQPEVYSIGPDDAPALRLAQFNLLVHLRLEELGKWAKRCFQDSR